MTIAVTNGEQLEHDPGRRRLDRHRHRLRHLPAGGGRARLRHRRRRHHRRLQEAARRDGRAAEVQRPARQDGRLHLLRGQPPGRERRRRQHVLLALLLHRRRARRDRGRGRPGRVHQYHFYRDMRTYGKYELLYAEALEKGSAFVKFPDDEPPAVEKDVTSGGLTVTARDLLSEGEEVALTADLVVLVTGMVPRENERAHQDAQAAGGPERLLQRDPSQAAPGRDGRGRRLHLRRLPGAADLVRGRRLRPRRGHPERRHPQARLRRARPAGRDRRRRHLHLVRRLRDHLPLRRHRQGRRTAARRSPRSPGRPARAAAAASPSARPTPSTCRATPTPRSRR